MIYRKTGVQVIVYRTKKHAELLKYLKVNNGVSKRGLSPSFFISPSPLKERETKVKDSSRGEVDKIPHTLNRKVMTSPSWTR